VHRFHILATLLIASIRIGQKSSIGCYQCSEASFDGTKAIVIQPKGRVQPVNCGTVRERAVFTHPKATMIRYVWHYRCMTRLQAVYLL